MLSTMAAATKTISVPADLEHSAEMRSAIDKDEFVGLAVGESSK